MASPALADGKSDLDAAFRAWQQGQREQAIRMFSRAIDDPSLPLATRSLAFLGRAQALQSSGDYQGAIADYDAASQLVPSPTTSRLRGIANILWGRFEAAGDDFAQSLKLEPASAETAIWLRIAYQKSGQGGTRHSDDFAKIDFKTWPGPVLALMIGRGTPDEAETAARSADPAVRAARECDLSFFLGEQWLNEGYPDALRLLRRARDVCTPGTPERLLSRMDLLRGGQ